MRMAGVTSLRYTPPTCRGGFRNLQDVAEGMESHPHRWYVAAGAETRPYISADPLVRVSYPPVGKIGISPYILATS